MGNRQLWGDIYRGVEPYSLTTSEDDEPGDSEFPSANNIQPTSVSPIMPLFSAPVFTPLFAEPPTTSIAILLFAVRQIPPILDDLCLELHSPCLLHFFQDFPPFQLIRVFPLFSPAEFRPYFSLFLTATSITGLVHKFFLFVIICFYCLLLCYAQSLFSVSHESLFLHPPSIFFSTKLKSAAVICGASSTLISLDRL